MTNQASGGGQTPPGWYPDAQGQMRWWDGSKWTQHAQGPNPGTYGAAPAPQFRGAQHPINPPPPTQPWYLKKGWWVAGGVVLVLFIIGAAAGGGASEDGDPAASESTTSSTDEESKTKPDEPKSKPKAKAKTKAKAKSQPQAMKVQAGRMLNEFKGNEAAADAKYKGKDLQITGHVAKVDTEFLDDNQYVVRLDGGAEFAVLSVNCNDVNAGQAAKVQVDSTVTVRGKFDDGGDLGVEIKDCEVV